MTLDIPEVLEPYRSLDKRIIEVQHENKTILLSTSLTGEGDNVKWKVHVFYTVGETIASEMTVHTLEVSTSSQQGPKLMPLVHQSWETGKTEIGEKAEEITDALREKKVKVLFEEDRDSIAEVGVPS